MDEELKKRTALEIIKKKFLLNYRDRGLSNGIVKIYEKDFPFESGMDFGEVGQVLKRLKDQYSGQIEIQGVFNLSTDLEPFIGKDCIPTDSLRSGDAYYKLEIQNKGAISNAETNDTRPKYIEDKDCGYLSFGKKGAGKIRIGRRNTIQCQVLRALSDPEFGVLRAKDSALELIENALAKSVDEIQIDEAMKAINQKLKNFGVRLRLEKAQRQWRLVSED